MLKYTNIIELINRKRHGIANISGDMKKIDSPRNQLKYILIIFLFTYVKCN